MLGKGMATKTEELEAQIEAIVAEYPGVSVEKINGVMLLRDEPFKISFVALHADRSTKRVGLSDASLKREGVAAISGFLQRVRDTEGTPKIRGVGHPWTWALEAKRQHDAQQQAAMRDAMKASVDAVNASIDTALASKRQCEAQQQAARAVFEGRALATGEGLAYPVGAGGGGGSGGNYHHASADVGAGGSGNRQREAQQRAEAEITSQHRRIEAAEARAGIDIARAEDQRALVAGGGEGARGGNGDLVTHAYSMGASAGRVAVAKCPCGAEATRFVYGVSNSGRCSACWHADTYGPHSGPVRQPTPPATHCTCGAELMGPKAVARLRCGDCAALTDTTPVGSLDDRIAAAKPKAVDPDPTSAWGAGATPSWDWVGGK